MRITHSVIDPSYDFNERKKNDTLIPGEVYNFFIHFVAKPGFVSNNYTSDKHINHYIYLILIVYKIIRNKIYNHLY